MVTGVTDAGWATELVEATGGSHVLPLGEVDRIERGGEPHGQNVRAALAGHRVRAPGAALTVGVGTRDGRSARSHVLNGVPLLLRVHMVSPPLSEGVGLTLHPAPAAARAKTRASVTAAPPGSLLK